MYPPPSAAEIQRIEQELGLSLPVALKRLYTARGNGGFGPDYGFLGLGSGHKTDLGNTAIELYRSFMQKDPEDPGWEWPSELFPVLHIGCAVHFCVNLRDPSHPVVKFDPNGFGPGEDWAGAFVVVSRTVDAWLKDVIADGAA